MSVLQIPVEIQIELSMEKRAILYSFEQKAFQIESVRDYIKSNIESSLRKQQHQYRLIAIVDNDDIADNIITAFRSKFNW